MEGAALANCLHECYQQSDSDIKSALYTYINMTSMLNLISVRDTYVKVLTIGPFIATG